MNPSQPIDIRGGFGTVDASGAAEHFVNYLDRVTPLSFFQAYKRRSIDLLDLRPGDRVLDVGCGTGEDALAIAARVAPGGQVVGLDASEAMIAAAVARADSSGLPVVYRHGDAYALPYEDGSFSAVRADRVFQHLAAPEEVLAEMVRAAAPGARVFVADPDWETLTVTGAAVGLTRRILNMACDRAPNGWSGRRLFGLFQDAGLVEIGLITEVLPLTDLATADHVFQLRAAADLAQDRAVISAPDVADWWAALSQAQARGRFLATITGFEVLGRKPESG